MGGGGVERERGQWWINTTQHKAEGNRDIEGIKLQLNVKLNKVGILECRGRIEGDNPIHLPRNCIYTQKVVVEQVEQALLAKLHGGVALTMTRICEQFWVPKLRYLVKRARCNCHDKI